jgi:RNA polymerase sigma-70 factor (ECF subfamily)
MAEDESETRPVPAKDRTDDQAVDRDSLGRALRDLPASMRTVVILKDVYGLSCREIGDELGVSEGAVKVRLHRARRRLKNALFGGDPGHEV